MTQADSVPHSLELCSRLASAQKYGELCDLVLACKGQTIPVHKAIVCLQSPVIKAACTGPFLEAAGTYEINDCSFETLQQMIEYMYTGDYQEKSEDQSKETHELVTHVTMFSLADVYLIDGLLSLSETKFRTAVKAESSISVLLRHVSQVYDLQCNSGKVLREIMVEQLRQRLPSIEELDQQVLQDLFRDIPEFTRDIATSFIQRPLTAQQPSKAQEPLSSCPKCEHCADRTSQALRRLSRRYGR